MALLLILGMSLIIIIITIIIIIIFIGFMKLLLQRLRYKLPPGPFPLPILGNFFDLEAKPILVRGFTDWAQIHGPIFSLYFGPYLGIVVNTVELAKQVLKDNDQHLANRNRTMLIAKFSKNGKDLMWSDYGPHYVKVRKLCTLQLFSMKRIDALRPIRHDEVTAMVESIYNDYCIKPENKGKALAMREYLARMAFLHMTRLTFGKRFVDSDGNIDAQGQELKRILENGGKLFSKESIAEFVPWIAFLFRGEKRALEEQVAMVDSFTKKIMQENALARNKTGNTKNHFLDALLTLQEEYDLSEDTIIGLLWDMISAGMESVIIAVEWGMAEMVRNLRVQKKIQEELHRVIGHDRVMTEADIPNLPYLQCAIKECLRIHSPTPLMLPHQASTDVKIGGYDVPKGATVTVNTWAISRDPAVWKDPLEFRPERFQEEDIDMKGTDYRLLPFGSGRRYCPGAQLAITLVSSMIGHLLHHFSWASPPGVKPEDMDMMEEPGTVTYMGTPLQAVPTPRLSAHLHKRVAVGNV